MFDRSKFISFDVETSSKVRPEYALQPFRLLKGEAFVSSFSTMEYVDGKSSAIVFSEYVANQVMVLLQHAIDSNKTIIAWNAPFDAAWLIAMGLEDLVMRCKWLDAMLLWKHLTVTPEYEKTAGKKKSYGLKEAVSEFYPQHAGYEEDIDFHSDDPEVVAKRLSYNKKDAIFTFMLAEKFYNELAKEPARLRAALIEAQCIPMIAGTIVRGLNVDVKAAEDLYRMLDEEKFKHLDDLEPHGATPEILASPAQLSKLLFETWGLPVIKTTAKGQPSTDKESLHELFTTVEDKRAESVRRYREAIGNQNKFAEGTLDSVKYNGDGCTRPGFKIFGTYTGRGTFASKQGKGKNAKPVGIPLHQMKADRGGKHDKFYRKMLMAPPGYSIVEYDAAGQEFRFMAILSGDETMLQLCLPGEDPHSYMGSRIVQADYHEFLADVKAGKKKAKQDRNLGKFCICEGELVLTNRGLVPIQEVELYDTVWDGVEWVTHTGAVYQGEKHVISYDGLTATLDHRVFLEDGRNVEFQYAASEGLKLARSGDGGKAIRVLDNNLGPGVTPAWKHLSGVHMQVWKNQPGGEAEPFNREVERMQELREYREAQNQGARNDERSSVFEGAEEMFLNAPEVLESKRSELPQLRWERNRIPFQIGIGGDSLCTDESSAPDIHQSGYRSGRQQRTLRARESEVGVSIGESNQQENEQTCNFPGQGDTSAPRISRSSDSLAGCEVRGSGGSELGWEGSYIGANTRQVSQLTQLQTKGVWDITNAGPRHRYTVSGRLVSNSNLSFQYRISAKSATAKARVNYNLDVQIPFIEQIKNVYLSTYTGVPKYWTRQIYKAARQGYVETLAGRRVQLGSDQRRSSWAVESTAINYPVQGVGADQKYLAFMCLKPLLTKFGGHLWFELHDGIFCIVPNEKVEQFAVEGKKILDNLPYTKAWGFTPPVPMPWDCKTGKRWSELKEFVV